MIGNWPCRWLFCSQVSRCPTTAGRFGTPLVVCWDPVELSIPTRLWLCFDQPWCKIFTRISKRKYAGHLHFSYVVQKMENLLENTSILQFILHQHSTMRRCATDISIPLALISLTILYKVKLIGLTNQCNMYTVRKVQGSQSKMQSTNLTRHQQTCHVRLSWKLLGWGFSLFKKKPTSPSLWGKSNLSKVFTHCDYLPRMRFLSLTAGYRY